MHNPFQEKIEERESDADYINPDSAIEILRREGNGHGEL